MTADAFSIEPLRHETDLEAILRVDAASFSRPWTRAMYEAELGHPERSIILVARTGDGEIAGYVACWTVADELHINNVAVLPAFRRRGVARALVRYALELGRRRGAGQAWLEVRSTNAGARSLYRSLGFKDVGSRAAYYSDPPDDAVVMTAEIH